MVKSIPTFQLYGEPHGWPTPDLLHWEAVASRSRLHNWQIKPHRHTNLMQLIYLVHGRGDAQLDGKAVSLRPPCLLVVPPLAIHGFTFSTDVEGHVLTLAAPLVDKLSQQLDNAYWPKQDCQLLNDPTQMLFSIFNNIASEYTGHHLYRNWALETAVNQLLIALARLMPQTVPATQHANGRSRQYLARFNHLVEQHFTEHWLQAQFAEQLGISVPHLNSICRELTQQTALQLVHQRLLLEAKRNLIYTAMTISQIAFSLGFSEPAYFTRFFKRLTGVSPQLFRRESQ